VFWDIETAPARSNRQTVPSVSKCRFRGSVYVCLFHSGLASMLWDMNALGWRSNVALKGGICLVLWLPALLGAAFVSFIGYIGTGFAPFWSNLPFLLALPAVLVGLVSFRTSAIVTFVLLTWDAVATTWPHIALTGFLDSTIDVLLLTTTGLAGLVAVFSPFGSFLGLLRDFRDR